MDAHVLTVGGEILAGDILDSNFHEIAAAFRDAGIRVTAHASVADDVDAIAGTIRRSVEEVDIVFVTGGLGPTPDDLTREGTARALGVGQTLREDLVPDLEAMFRSHGGRTMPVSNLNQLRLPDGAEAISNPNGSAPGFRIETPRAVVFAVPGVPREMRWMLHEAVLPWLREHRSPTAIQVRLLRTQGIGESDLAERLAPHMDAWRGVGVAFYPHLPGVDVKLSHFGKDPRRMKRELDQAESEARRILGTYVYGSGKETLAEVVLRMLGERGWRLAVAESCTGGRVAAALTAVPGSSKAFDGGVVSYSNRAKSELLGVDPELLATHGAVSEAAARAMAEGMRERSGADVALGVTGIAGPGGGTAGKPVGLVYTAVAAPGGTRCWEMRHPGVRDAVQQRATSVALNRLRLVLLGEP